MLAGGMSMFADHGFYKRAQITGSDLELAGVASFGDIDRLTIFADNLVPHVLRCDGVLVYDERLAAHIDAGRRLRPGPQEREIRACAVHACALLARADGHDRARHRQRAVDARRDAGVQGGAAPPLPDDLLLRREAVRVERREVDERASRRRAPAPARGR